MDGLHTEVIFLSEETIPKLVDRTGLSEEQLSEKLRVANDLNLQVIYTGVVVDRYVNKEVKSESVS